MNHMTETSLQQRAKRQWVCVCPQEQQAFQKTTALCRTKSVHRAFHSKRPAVSLIVTSSGSWCTQLSPGTLHRLHRLVWYTLKLDYSPRHLLPLLLCYIPTMTTDIVMRNCHILQTFCHVSNLFVLISFSNENIIVISEGHISGNDSIMKHDEDQYRLNMEMTLNRPSFVFWVAC